MEGNSVETYYTTIPFTYKNKSYASRRIPGSRFKFLFISQVKAESGVNLVGVVGNSFLQKYKYIL